MDASEYPMSHLEDIKLKWQDPDLNMNIVFPPGVKLFSPPGINGTKDGFKGSKHPILTHVHIFFVLTLSTSTGIHLVQVDVIKLFSIWLGVHWFFCLRLTGLKKLNSSFQEGYNFAFF